MRRLRTKRGLFNFNKFVFLLSADIYAHTTVHTMEFNGHRRQFSTKCENQHRICAFFALCLSLSISHRYRLSRQNTMKQMYRLQIPHHLLPATQALANQHFHAYEI